MYKGNPTEGIEFYNLLFDSDEFNKELGKVTLSAGRLEVEIILFLNRNGVKDVISRAPLGKLIEIGEKNNLFDNNLTAVLRLICKQRNYLTHNIYALFTELIDETILERNDLLDSDIYTYIERVCQLRNNLIYLTSVISKK
jgi:uncharacterized protein YutE (UPF0331/DUF86 family)